MSASSVVEVVAEAEAMGIELRLRDGRVKATFLPEMQREVTPILVKLRANRKKVVEVLQLRSAPRCRLGCGSSSGN